MHKKVEDALQHTFVYDAASIGVFKYKKSAYSAGVKYRF